MKFFGVLIIFMFLAFPCFAQNANSDRYQSLSDTMGNTISRSQSNLDNYNMDLRDSGNNGSFASYNDKYNSLSRRLKESEARMDLYTRTNDKTSTIKAERDKYEDLINQLESLKSDYDNWLKNTQ